MRKYFVNLFQFEQCLHLETDVVVYFLVQYLWLLK